MANSAKHDRDIGRLAALVPLASTLLVVLAVLLTYHWVLQGMDPSPALEARKLAGPLDLMFRLVWGTTWVLLVVACVAAITGSLLVLPPSLREHRVFKIGTALLFAIGILLQLGIELRLADTLQRLLAILLPAIAGGPLNILISLLAK